MPDMLTIINSFLYVFVVMIVKIIVLGVAVMWGISRGYNAPGILGWVVGTNVVYGVVVLWVGIYHLGRYVG